MKDIFFKTIMLKGEAGSSVVSVEKTGTSGIVDTYTITFNDGTTATFEVTNGNSVVSIEKTATAGYIDTYTITLGDGSTFDFEVTNGINGTGYEVPANGVIYYDASGELPQGYEPTTVPNFMRGGTLGTESSPDNLDSLIGNNAIYFVNANYAVNAPISAGYGYLECFSPGSVSTIQRFTVFSSPNYGTTYIRIYINSQWYSWQKVAQAIT